MSEDIKDMKKQLANYEEKFANMMNEIMSGRNLIQKLEEVIKSKDALIQDCSEHHQRKAANEETYTQAMGQRNGRMDIATSSPREAECASTSAQGYPRRQDGARVQESTRAHMQDGYSAFRNRGQRTTRRSASRQSSIISRQTSTCLLYTSPSPRDRTRSRMPSSA